MTDYSSYPLPKERTNTAKDTNTNKYTKGPSRATDELKKAANDAKNLPLGSGGMLDKVKQALNKKRIPEDIE